MNLDLIEKMKQNRVPNYLLTEEEFQCLKDAEPYVEYYLSHLKNWKPDNTIEDRDSLIVNRIRKDYNVVL